MSSHRALNSLSRHDQAIADRLSGYRSYVDQRNISVHQYTRIDWEKVGRALTVELPTLAEEVEALIAELEAPIDTS